MKLVAVQNRAFEQFYEDEYVSVVAFVRAITGDRTRAEDATQEAFAAALAAWDGLENPEAWVRRVAANKARSWWRRWFAEQRAVTRLARPQMVGLDLGVEAEEFWALVRRLPGRQSETIVLFYGEDRPVSEIAEMLECSESTVRVHLMRARRRLAEWLEIEDV